MRTTHRSPSLATLLAFALLSACGEDDPPAGGGGSTAYSPVWSVNIGGSSDDVVLDAAVAGAGTGFILGGSFSGMVTFGSETLSSHGGVLPDGFVSRLDETGTPSWTRRFGGANSERVTAVAVGSDGTVFAAAEFDQTIDVDGVVLASAGEMDTVLVALAATDGSILWYRQLGATGGIYAGDLEWRAGQVLLAGRFTGMVDFSGISMTATAGSDAFISAHDETSGNRLWTEPYAGPGDEAATRLFIGNGAPILAGTFDATVTLGGTEHSTAGDDDIFLAALVPTDGAVSWSVRFGGAGRDVVVDIAQRDPANLWLAGSFAESATFGAATANSAGGRDAFLAKLRTLGEVEWVKSLGGADADAAIGLAIDPADYVLTAGTVTGAVDLGLGATQGATTPELYTAAYASLLGDVSWAQRFRGALTPVRLLDDGAGRYYVIGNLTGSATVGADVLDSTGGTDLWVTALDWVP